jgi:hypothetical protein
MSTPVGRRSNLLLITLLLAISVLLEQFFIAPILPWLGNLGSIRPMVVFLDIPLELPKIDLLPVAIIFALFYQVAPSAGLAKEHPSISSGARVWKALSGLGILLILLVAGGGAYYYALDYLPRSVSNGIDSFGVRADLTLPYPSGGLIHLHGSVVMFAFSAIGVLILNRRTATPVAAPAVQQLQADAAYPAANATANTLSSSIVSSAGTLISSAISTIVETDPHARYQPATIIPGYEKPLIPASKPAPVTTPAPKAKPVREPASVATIAPPTTAPVTAPAPPSTRSYVQRPAPRTTTIITPEPPPTCRLTTPPPIAVVMPRPAPGIGKMHPCYVIGSLKPVKIP